MNESMVSPFSFQTVSFCFIDQQLAIDLVGEKISIRLMLLRSVWKYKV
jgi:hypothetical protein